MILYFVLIFINAELSVVLHEVIIYTLLYLSASLYISCNNVNALSPQSAINSIASINIYSGLFSNHKIASSTSQSHNSFTFFPVDKFSARVTNTYSFPFNSFLHTTDLPEPAFPCIDTNFSRPACIVSIISIVKFNCSEYFERSNTLLCNFITTTENENLNNISQEVDFAEWYDLKTAQEVILHNSLAEKFYLEAIKKIV